MSEEKTTTYRIEQLVTARVEQVFPFGAFVRLDDGTEAYVRRRELTQAGDLDPQRVVSKGDPIKARVIRLARPKRLMELSVRQAEPDPWDAFLQEYSSQDTVRGTVKTVGAAGVQVQVLPGVDGYLNLRELAPWRIEDPGDLLWIGDQIEAVITMMSPGKWMHLSIKRQMVKWVTEERRRRDVDARLRDLGIIAEPEDESDIPATEEPAEILQADLGALGPILVFDEDREVEEELGSWLQLQGGHPVRIDSVADGLNQEREEPFALAMMDPDLAQQDGLDFLRRLREMQENIQILVMTNPEWIAGQSEQLEALRIAYAFTKPLDFDEVLEVLSRLALGEAVGPFSVTQPDEENTVADSFQRLAEAMRTGSPVETRLQAALIELLRLSGAESGVLFHLDPDSQQVSILAQAGRRTVEPSAMPGLARSPVKDLIVEGRYEFETSLSSEVKRKRFANLLEAVAFESCIGVPVSSGGQVAHALFLFHTWPEAFDRADLRDARTMATLLSVALESQTLEAQLAAASPFLLSGQLSSAFSHDVSNKMDLLDLQVRNLKSRCQALEHIPENSVRFAEQETSELMAKLEQLLENALDLKTTAHTFRELLGADQQEQVDVNESLELTSKMLEMAAHRGRIRVWLDLAPDLPPVAGSPLRLRHVYLNVMLNAIQQIALKLEQWPQGLGELTISTSVDAEAEREIQVRFTDSGPGIHRHLWDQIFSLGYSTRPGGSGLGLFIARSLVESMGGSICVEESLIPQGTVFRIDLPADYTRAKLSPERTDD